MRAPILCLLLALACSRYASAAETADTIEAMQGNCLASPLAGAATTAQCQTCVDTIGNLNGLTSQRMYACYDLCQNTTYLNGNSATDCIDCIEDPAYDVTACKQCLAVPNGGSAACFTCMANDPYKNDNLNASQIYKRLNYFYACAQCASLSNDAGGRDQCFTCISSKTAKPQGSPDFGILTYIELHPPAGTPAPAPRDNDLGACVFLANQTELIADGSLAVQGIYASCIPEGYTAGDSLPLSLYDCMNCMSTVDAVLVDNKPRFPPMSYACADYCQNSTYYPAGISTADQTALATSCVNCLESPKVTSAWACGNCMKSADPDVCFQCVYDEPYSGNTSNYNWACGMCANIEDANVQNLCLQCIQNQPGAGAGNTDEFTEANICSCIDLIQNNSISVNRSLTAMERTCFEPFTKRDSSGALVDPQPDIPWGNTTVSGNTSDCVTCMQQASVGVTLPGLNKAYACHEYCQDPDLVSGSTQGSDCASCVTNTNVFDPSACKTCMSATTIDVNRQACFTCVTTPNINPMHSASHAWACGQCAQLPASVQAFCFKCLSDDVFDPCECIDGIKNGTLLNAVGGGLCGSTAPNMIQDGCFEGCAGIPGAGACGWEVISSGGFSGYSSDAASTSATGCGAFYFGGAVGGRDIRGQGISNILPGVTYELGWWMLAYGDVPSELSLVIDGITLLFESSTLGTQPNTGGTWQHFSLTFVGASSSPSVLFQLLVRDDPYYIYLTGFSIQPCP